MKSLLSPQILHGVTGSNRERGVCNSQDSQHLSSTHRFTLKTTFPSADCTFRHWRFFYSATSDVFIPRSRSMHFFSWTIVAFRRVVVDSTAHAQSAVRRCRFHRTRTRICEGLHYLLKTWHNHSRNISENNAYDQAYTFLCSPYSLYMLESNLSSWEKAALCVFSDIQKNETRDDNHRNAAYRPSRSLSCWRADSDDIERDICNVERRSSTTHCKRDRQNAYLNNACLRSKNNLLTQKTRDLLDVLEVPVFQTNGQHVRFAFVFSFPHNFEFIVVDLDLIVSDCCLNLHYIKLKHEIPTWNAANSGNE